MRYFLIFTALMCLVIAGGIVLGSGQEPVTSNPEISRVYPIAPGVWYPGDGALPEKPIRYYRVRCWPGCHRGSSHGKYKYTPLNMKPIFPTSTVPAQPTTPRDTK